MQDTYKPVRRFEPGKALIVMLETVLGLIGVITLILYFYAGSFTGAGQKLDAGINAILMFILPLLGQG
ncbi:MAG: hypothetical protein QM667_08175 [Asticcacaulis sp.]